MAAIITSKFRFHNAEQFKESFSEAAPTNYYLYIGRPSEFATGTTGGTDSAPPTPVDNRRSEAYHWDDMLAAKKIDSTGVTHAIPRRDLDTSGSTTYDMYRPNYSATTTATSGATNLFDSTFYFMTSAYRVYKVLDNAVNGTAAAWSGTEGTPTSTGSAPITTGNYKIKYMFTLSTTQVQNFLTPDFIACPTAAESGNGLVDGRLDVIKITTVGAVTPVPTNDLVVYNVPVRGDGTGGLASVTIGGSSGSNGGQITTVAVTAVGSSYTHANIFASDIKEQYDLQQSGTLTVGTAPVFEIVIGPDGGHGGNPARELGGHFAMMDVKLQQTETYDFSVVNDFRQVGVLRNPYSFGTSSAYTSTSARQTFAIKLTNATSGTFGVDEKISQALATPTVSGITVSGSTLTVTTSAAHGFATGQLVGIGAGTFSGGSTDGHRGTHYIIVTSTTQFTYEVGSQRTPTGTMSGTATCVPTSPQATVVEFDASNNILFYIQTSYLNQGTGEAGESIPFSGSATITGAGSTATGIPDTAYSSSLNNTAFTAGYSNPEMQPDSGDIIYMENRKPISRASDQTEDIKLIVEF
tara:strand:- start:7444 stop:9183 length:1740 start_codon:yes stop_codon:yes gene_type:complete